MLELGSYLEEFNLLNTVSGNDFSSSELDEAKPSLVMFICNHCPYVIHYHQEIQLNFLMIMNDIRTMITNKHN